MSVEQAARSIDLDVVRDQRSDLRVDLMRLEQALAAPLPGRLADWVERVHDVLVDLAATFERHIALTQGTDGLFDDVLRAAPRLANHVTMLTDEHNQLRVTMADLLVTARTVERSGDVDDASELRGACMDLLSTLSRHRQHGADLVYEAYTVDIGVGD